MACRSRFPGELSFGWTWPRSASGLRMGRRSQPRRRGGRGARAISTAGWLRRRPDRFKFNAISKSNVTADRYNFRELRGMGVHQQYARRQLPAEVEIEIISRLFNALPQVLCVTTGLVVGSAFMVAYQPDTWAITVLVLGLVDKA